MLKETSSKKDPGKTNIPNDHRYKSQRWTDFEKKI